MADNTTKKQSGFQPGQSGNPAGRPRGALNKATVAAQTLLDGEAAAITRVCIDQALDGNMAAVKLCLERILPARKERPISVKLPKVETAADLPKLTAAMLNAVASGKMEAGQAASLAHLITAHSQALEASDFERRLTELEQQKNHPFRVTSDAEIEQRIKAQEAALQREREALPERRREVQELYQQYDPKAWEDAGIRIRRD